MLPINSCPTCTSPLPTSHPATPANQARGRIQEPRPARHQGNVPSHSLFTGYHSFPRHPRPRVGTWGLHVVGGGCSARISGRGLCSLFLF